MVNIIGMPLIRYFFLYYLDTNVKASRSVPPTFSTPLEMTTRDDISRVNFFQKMRYKMT